MKKTGFTLIEVVLAITLLSLLAVAFLPAITFGYTHLIDSMKFTNSAFQAQQEIELEMEAKRSVIPTDPTTTKTIKVFNVDVIGHVIQKEITSGGNKHGELNVFLPKPVISYTIPVIQSPPVIKVRNNVTEISPQPSQVYILDTDKNLYVSEINITTATKSEFLMNVYRWFYYDEYDNDVDPNSKNYLIIKEWNGARKLVSYADSEQFSFIPNIKTNYNVLNFSEFGLTEEALINRFGGKYVRYSVTPFSLIGKIGKEEFSNQIYISAPEIKIIDAAYLINLNADLSVESSNKVVIRFQEAIKQDSFDTDKMNFNSELGNIRDVYSPSIDNKSLIVEFENDIDTSISVANNILEKGAVQSETYGTLNIKDSNFTLSKKYVQLDSASKYNIKIPSINRSIDVSGAGTSNTSGIIIWDSHENDNQKWFVLPIGNSQYSHIVAAHDIDRALMHNLINNQLIRGTKDDNVTAQHWVIEKDGDNYIFRSRDDYNYSISIQSTANNTPVKALNNNYKWELILK